MSAVIPTAKPAIIYPESDGQPMADNTLQFRWITVVQGNLAALFADRPDVFVAGDLLWYPVEGRPDIRRAPDVMVAIGRPKGDRGAYLQWEEGGQPPQVVFEIWSPGNTAGEMARKHEFYERYGVSEYYLIDPQQGDATGWVRQGEQLHAIDEMNGWVSPLLGVRFAVTEDGREPVLPGRSAVSDVRGAGAGAIGGGGTGAGGSGGAGSGSAGAIGGGGTGAGGSGGAGSGGGTGAGGSGGAGSGSAGTVGSGGAGGAAGGTAARAGNRPGQCFVM
jgi:Uma2 family endonuclease